MQTITAVATEVQPLSDSTLRGKEMRIVSFTGSPERMGRLHEMGLLEGTRVKVLRPAPLGDPVAIMVRGYRLALRLRDAACISVAAA